MPAPAGSHWVLRTPDLAVARRAIAGVFKPFVLEATGNGPYDARIWYRRFAATTATIIDYGGGAHVDVGRPGDRPLIHVPLRAGYVLHGRGRERAVGCGQAHVVAPHEHLRMTCAPACRLLVLRPQDARLTAVVNARHADGGEPVLVPCGVAGALGRVVDLLVAEIAGGDLIDTGPRCAEAAEILLVGAMLAVLSAGGAREGRAGEVLVRAQRHALAHLGWDITAADLAAAAGVSERTLQRAFLAATGESPLRWLRRRRLERVRDALLDARCSARPISELAADAGWNHFGRFAAAYRAAYGESPADTRRRTRLCR